MNALRSQPAARLRALREQAGLSLQKMADAVGSPLSTYRHYEERFKEPWLPMSFALQVADALSKYGIERHTVLALAGESPTTPLVGPGFSEAPGQSSVRRALENLDATPTASPPSPSDLKIGTDGTHVQVVATVDRAGLDRLIRRLEAMKMVLDN